MQSVDEVVRVVIVTDVRLQTDIVSLQRASADKANATGCAVSVFYVRIHCTDEIRQRFGWKFDEAVDRHFTETNLDDFTAWLVFPFSLLYYLKDLTLHEGTTSSKMRAH